MNYKNIYLPENLESNSYIYRLSDDSIVQIITNNNCTTQYQTTYCDCYDYFINRGVSSGPYSCNRNQNTHILARSDFGFDDTMSNYQAGLFSWGNLIFVVGVIWMICYFLMKSK